MAQLIPYDDRDGQIWLMASSSLGATPRCMCSPMACTMAAAVFEGERCYAGRIFKSTEHSQRLIDSGRILGFEVPYSAAELDAAKAATWPRWASRTAMSGPIAWRGSEQMGVSAQQSRINVAIAVWEWGAYYSDLRLTRAIYDRPAPNTAPVHAKAAGLYMICTDLQARRRGQGLRRRADAGLSRLRRRDHRRQPVPRHRRRDPYADAGLLPQRHHPADGDRPRAQARLRGDRAPHHARRSCATRRRSSSPAPRPRSRRCARSTTCTTSSGR